MSAVDPTIPVNAPITVLLLYLIWRELRKKNGD